jgi:hypothetical protein
MDLFISACLVLPFNTTDTPFQLIRQFRDKARFENTAHEMQAALCIKRLLDNPR